MILAKRRVDLVVEDQRQPGNAQHQQEHGRDQARPLVDEEPALDRRSLHLMQPFARGHGESAAFAARARLRDCSRQ